MSAIIKFSVLTTATLAVAALIAGTAGGATSRYAPLLSATAGQDTLRNIALWEDQRITNNGRIFEYLKEGSPLVRRRVIEAIGRMQQTEDAARVIPSLKDSNREVVREAIFALGQIGNRSAVEPLLKARSGSAPDDIAMIADALGKLGGDQAMEALVDMLRDFNASVRGAAALSLARTPGDAAASALLLAVHDPDMSVKWRAIYAIEKQPVLPRTCQTVMEFLESDDAQVRAFAARTLGKTKCHAASKKLVKLLADPDLHVAVNAARALGELKAKDAVQPLSALLMSHKPHDLRATAAEALENIGEKGGRDALMQGMLDTSVLVRTQQHSGTGGLSGREERDVRRPGATGRFPPGTGDGHRVLWNGGYHQTRRRPGPHRQR